MDERYRLDDLARQAGVASTTVRLYQNKGLLPGPTVVGRTGWYDAAHLARLRLIARLQDDGFSLAGIRRLLDGWEEGRRLEDIVGVDDQVEALLGRQRAVVLTADQLADRLDGADAGLVARAADLGLVEATDDGRYLVPDERFLTTGIALLRLGIPAAVVLDEWEHLVGVTDDIAGRFVDLFERHIVEKDWTALQSLRDVADRVVIAALDASMARLATTRLAAIVPD